jgi:hypothetical protein
MNLKCNEIIEQGKVLILPAKPAAMPLNPVKQSTKWEAHISRRLQNEKDIIFVKN